MTIAPGLAVVPGVSFALGIKECKTARRWRTDYPVPMRWAVFILTEQIIVFSAASVQSMSHPGQSSHPSHRRCPGFGFIPDWDFR